MTENEAKMIAPRVTWGVIWSTLVPLGGFWAPLCVSFSPLYTKMMQKDLDLNTYLFGTTKEELPEADVKEMTERLHKEMNEIFYGRNMPDMTQYNT